MTCAPEIQEYNRHMNEELELIDCSYGYEVLRLGEVVIFAKIK